MIRSKPKIAHLTSVHPLLDPRIFLKQCRSIAQLGSNIVLIIPHERDETIDGVQIHALPRPRSRIDRMSRIMLHMIRAALEEKADIYHLHDPELLVVGRILHALGKPVIYDVHEDYTTAIRQKRYLPAAVRPALARFLGFVEHKVGEPLPKVIAERYYERRFPESTKVLNYPLLDTMGGAVKRRSSIIPRTRLLYTGNITTDRGALNHARILQEIPHITVEMIGHCSPRLAEEMRKLVGAQQYRLHIIGEDNYVPHSRISAAYMENGWLAGLALFPNTGHYREKELTKLFEYMHAGIPIICSDFPIWRELVHNTGTGLCVDPNSTADVTQALEWLAGNPDEALLMGKRGQQLVSERFNWRQEFRKLIGLYNTLLPQNGPRFNLSMITVS